MHAEFGVRSQQTAPRTALSSEAIQTQLQQRQNDLEQLAALGVGFARAGLSDNRFSKDIHDARIDLPPFGYYPSAQQALLDRHDIIAPSYETPPPQAAMSTDGFLNLLLEPRRTHNAKFLRRVSTDNVVRSRLEKQFGGEITPIAQGRGKLVVSRLTAPAATATTAAPQMVQAPSSQRMYDLLMAMDVAILDQAKALGLYQSSSGVLGGTRDPSQMNTIAQGLSTNMTGNGADQALLSPGQKDEILQSPTSASSQDLAIAQLERMIERKTQSIEAYNKAFQKYGESGNTAVNNLKA